MAKQEKAQILSLHRNAQRLLKPLHVINPYAEQLTFLDDKTRTRRDHEKYLTLIESIALLHQYQRTIKTIPQGDELLQYVEVTLDDIETANRLAHDVLGRSLDELPPQTRKLLLHIEIMVDEHSEQQGVDKTDVHFSRKDLRVDIGWGNTQLRVHLDRLVDMEYLLVHRGCRGQSYEYELLYDGQGKNGDEFLMGLIDIDQLKNSGTTSSLRGESQALAGSLRPHDGLLSGDERTTKNSEKVEKNRSLRQNDHEDEETAVTTGYNHTKSCRSGITMLAKADEG